MAETMNLSQIRIRERVREYFRPRKALWGLIQWEQFVRAKSEGHDVLICANTPVRIILNGKVIHEQK